jgi:hypothetical protein
MAHPEKLKKDGRAFTVFNKATKINYLDDGYEFNLLEKPSQITHTSYLVVGKLEPKSNRSLCTFIFRWDEKASSLDVDVENCPNKKLIERFRSDKDTAYYRHHPTKIPGAGWSFKTRIVWNSKQIFDGVISLNLGREAESSTTLRLKVSAQHTHTKEP